MGESSMNHDNGISNDGEAVRDGNTKVSWITSRAVKISAIVLASQMVITGIGWLYIKATTPEVVTFDMKGTMDLFIQQTLEQKLPEEQTKVLMARFNTAMKDSLQEWQDAHHSVILVAPAVVSQQTDITQEIRSGIATRMQGERR